ncbi:MAG TPA: hypothetical protein PLU35_09970 [Phycisphaerales bacterium]|nr:hypothetical protein [Phycisphaerales bacterium]
MRSRGDAGAFGALDPIRVECLEERRLLTQVYDYEVFQADGAWRGGTVEHATMLSGGGVGFVALGEDWLRGTYRIAGPGSGATKTDHTPSLLSDRFFAGNGGFAAWGWFRASESDPGISGLGMFGPGDAQPKHVLAPDMVAPWAKLKSVGLPEPESSQLLVTVLYEDFVQVDHKSLVGGNVVVKGPGLDTSASLVSIDAAQPGRARLATYSVTLPAQKGSFVISLAQGAKAAADTAGNRIAGGTLGMYSYDPASQGNGVWYQVSPPENHAHPWTIVPIRADAVKPSVAMSENGGRVTLSASFEEGPHVVWWNGTKVDKRAVNATVTRVMDDGRAVGVRSDGAVIHFSSPGGGPSVVAKLSDGPWTMTRNADMSRDGKVIVFQAARGQVSQDAESGFGIYGAVKGLFGWTTSLIVGAAGDGRLDFGETHWDLDGNGTFDNNVLFGASEDFGLNVHGPMAIHSTISADRRFTVYFESGGLNGDAIRTVTSRLDGSDIIPGAPETVAIPTSGNANEDDDEDLADLRVEAGLYVGAERAASARRLLPGDVPSVSLLANAVAPDGSLGLVARVYAQASHGDWTEREVFVRARPVGLRPVLVLPGLFGSMPEQGDFKDWLMRRGFEPDRLLIDPILRTYHDLLDTLEEYGGYQRGVTLFAATYDWRMPPAPIHEHAGTPMDVPPKRDYDGWISGFTAAELISDMTAGQYASGVHYLVYWLQQAKEAWEQAHPGVPLDSVDIIAHSTGGVVTRSYIQSRAYADEGLPAVNRFLSVAVPHYGASKAWNILHDNFAAESAYRKLIAPMLASALTRVRNGETVLGPNGDHITMARLGAALAINGAYRTIEEAFISLYTPTGRSLLATYPFVRPIGGGAFANVNSLPDANAIALDLHSTRMLPPGEEPPFGGFGGFGVAIGTLVLTSRVDVSVIFGTGVETLAYMQAHVSAPASGKKDVIATISGTWRAPEDGEVWWSDLDSSAGPAGHGAGDGTVPKWSAIGPFEGSPLGRRHEFRDTNHGQIMNGEKPQRIMLRELGLPTLFVSTGKYIDSLWDLICNCNHLKGWLAIVVDPVEAFIVDSQGRRLGWTAATGPLAEIPGSIYWGGADGIGWIFGDIPADLTLHLIGIEPDHLVTIVGATGGQPFSLVSEGAIGVGESRVLSVGVPGQDGGGDGDALRRVVPGTPVLGAADGAGTHFAAVRAPDGTIVFEQTGPGAWRAVRLDTAGRDPAVWIDASTGRTRVAVPTDAGLLLFTRGDDGSWTLRNLSDEAGGGVIASRVTAFVSRDGLAFVAGLDANGELLLYAQSDGDAWTATNLSREHLSPQGVVTPAFIGPIISYVTEWNGLNIAGLDASGAVHAVWWAPGMAAWTTSDLSAITGAPALHGVLTAYLTPWGGINLAGILADGALSVTWWVPSFGGEWRTSNLTADFAGPALANATLTSYVTPWGGLNVAGARTDGQIVIYWWSPGMEGWVVSPISEIIEGAELLVGAVAGVAAPTGTISLLGTSASGDAIRYHWSPPPGDDRWAMENLSLLASA